MQQSVSGVSCPHAILVRRAVFCLSLCGRGLFVSFLRLVKKLGGAMASEGSVAEGSKLKSAQLLEMVRTHLTTDAGKELQTKIGLVYQINIGPKKIGFEEESFVVDLKNLKVYKGKAEGKPDASFSFADADFISVASGKMNPQMAFIRGKMKIKGSMSAAQKFTPEIFPKPAKL